MGTRSKIEKWLLNDWSTSPNVAVDGQDLNLDPLDQANGAGAMAYERPLMEQQQRLTKVNETTMREKNMVHEGRDYSPSGSSWAPSEDGSSSDGSGKKGARRKPIKVEQCIRHYTKRRNGKSVPVPAHRPNAVVDVLKERQNVLNNKTKNKSRKRKHKETRAGDKSLPDSTKKHLPPPNDTIATVNKNNILNIKASFEEIFKIIDDMKPESERRMSKYFSNPTPAVPTVEDINMPAYNNTDVYDQSEESNRSDDNVLISNKYSKIQDSQDVPHEHATNYEEDEWVAIGSGKTLIHKDKYAKVKWKSYTIATRTLLLATFPRRILATHSLTGKRSPAFQDKPAKMCLDPKIVSDIIIEITSRFNVKENLVRSAITTKCADECKMHKIKELNKHKILQNLENAPPLNNPKQEPRHVKTE